ncbi:hypothetical protein AB5I41_29070 [Sphingomonas sp. MMS24-JH45]
MSLFLYLMFVLVHCSPPRIFPARSGFARGRPCRGADQCDDGRFARFLLVALVELVMLAKGLSVTVEKAILDAGLPLAYIVGVVIAALVLAPESLAAYRAAKRNRLQTSLNLALGSALATIVPTISLVAIVSLTLDLPLALGLSMKSIVLLILSLFTITLSLFYRGARRSWAGRFTSSSSPPTSSSR